MLRRSPPVPFKHDLARRQMVGSRFVRSMRKLSYWSTSMTILPSSGIASIFGHS